MSEHKPMEHEEIPADATYEALVGMLEQSVERLESGSLSLEDSVAEYERGMRLIQRCNEMLDTAELRITELSQRVGAPEGMGQDT